MIRIFKYLKENNVRIWNEWADEEGNLGPVYGQQWRSWGTADGRQIDQIRDVIEQIKKNPNSRRLIVSAWNVGEIRSNGLAALSYVLSILCGKWEAILSVISALIMSAFTE